MRRNEYERLSFVVNHFYIFISQMSHREDVKKNFDENLVYTDLYSWLRFSGHDFFDDSTHELAVLLLAARMNGNKEDIAYEELEHFMENDAKNLRELFCDAIRDYNGMKEKDNRLRSAIWDKHPEDMAELERHIRELNEATAISVVEKQHNNTTFSGPVNIYGSVNGDIKNLYLGDATKTAPAPRSNVKVPSSNEHAPLSEDEQIVHELSPIFYGNEDNARQFVKEIKSMKDVDICSKVKLLVQEKVISDISYKTDLYQVLQNHKLYKHGLRNWTKLVSRIMPKKK